jgi:hypothetical protein
MEWYTLDESLRKDQVIEEFASFIWTERYSAFGDFQIVTKSNLNSRTLLTPGTRLAMKDSFRVMTVDTVADDTAEDGTRNLTVTGKSIESLLDDRVAMPAFQNTTVAPNWVLTERPATIVRQMFAIICVNGALDPRDSIPFYRGGQLLPSGSIPEPADAITVTATPNTLYNSIKQICDTYVLGFRLVRNGEQGQLFFEVYTGNDLTSTQNVRKPVIFDPSLDNLEKINQLTSTALVKTVAYVFAANGTQVVYSPNADQTKSGSDRRVLLVSSSNNLPAGPALDLALKQEGIQALAKQLPVYSFDGQLPANIPYVYGKDYNLGDIVEERNSDGFGSRMIVTEQIFASDSTGEKAYPTLTLYQTIIPHTWISWDANETWSTVDPAETWSNA